MHNPAAVFLHLFDLAADLRNHQLYIGRFWARGSVDIWTPYCSIFGMKKLIVVLVLVSLAGPTPAKSWKGAVPGKTTRDEVIEMFGPPYKEFSKGGKLSNGLSYQADHAIEGALEANFYFDKHDVLFRIDVFPVKKITEQQVVRIFGTDYQERLTPKGYRYFFYPAKGMAVFFEKEGNLVNSFIFTQGADGKGTGGRKTERKKQKAGDRH
ncbi:MAG: hypothetical protein D6806_06670 [Deltaproteobacteria bacterium]|nr:MAG: hypothetical protein D6806_06670 [Deltaproteobacteria bacterium]